MSESYKLVLEANQYFGNFEREVVGYAFGFLDGNQMEIDYSERERDAFWREVMGVDTPNPRKAYSSDFDLRRYLDDCVPDEHDGYPGFYSIQNQTFLEIYLTQPFNEYWESIVIERIKKFFNSPKINNPENYDYLNGLKLKRLYLQKVDISYKVLSSDKKTGNEEMQMIRKTTLLKEYEV